MRKLTTLKNEFQRDWAYAAVRSGQIPLEKLKNRTVLVTGEDPSLCQAVCWSLEAWNEERQAGIRVKSVPFALAHKAAPKSFDYAILTGACCRTVPGRVADRVAFMNSWKHLLELLTSEPGNKKLLLLSDGRVYGKTEAGFAVSEYETGKTDTVSADYIPQYFLQALEAIFLEGCRKKGVSFGILRTGLLYGACYTPGLYSPVYRLAELTAKAEPAERILCPDRVSYLSLHDLLTAVQYILAVCPDNKIYNVSGADSDASEAELAMKLYHNFPDQCKVSLRWDSDPAPSEGVLLNTQLLEHAGFRPQISLEDGLIMLVKSKNEPQELFIFDHTYKGKLSRVQQILLGYLLEVDRICKKHGIRYFLAGGTLLGAVRHHGFIPWDDDADVMMLREDFDRFMEVAKDELPGNIFIQTSETEAGNHNAYTKLRIDDTLFATEFSAKYSGMHNGIFLDVLSHDQTGSHSWSQKLHIRGTQFSRSVVFHKWEQSPMRKEAGGIAARKLVDVGKYLIPMSVAEWMQDHAYRFFQNTKSGYLYDGMGRNLERGSFPKEWLAETVYLDFEGHSLPVPKEYDKYLTWLYGDYHEMIPVSSRRTSHSIVLMDLGSYCGYESPAPSDRYTG